MNKIIVQSASKACLEQRLHQLSPGHLVRVELEQEGRERRRLDEASLHVLLGALLAAQQVAANVVPRGTRDQRDNGRVTNHYVQVGRGGFTQEPVGSVDEVAAERRGPH